MEETHPLLALQALDSESDALLRRRAELPARAEIRACEAAIIALESERPAIRTRQAELEREEQGFAAEVAVVQQKALEVEKALYSGSATMLKEMRARQEELAGLKRRQAELEGQEMGVLERLEEVESELARVEQGRASHEARIAELRVEIAHSEGEVDAALAGLAARRAEAASRVAGAQLDAYQERRPRPRLAGLVAVAMQGTMCSGCRLALPATEAVRVRAGSAELPVSCPQCGRLLVVRP